MRHLPLLPLALLLATTPLRAQQRTASSLVEEARPFAVKKDWKQVLPLARRAVQADALDAQSRLLLGLALHGTGDCQAALPELEKAMELGIEPRLVARAAAECSEKGQGGSFWLETARNEKDLQAALVAARTTDSSRDRAEAYELAASLGKLSPEDLASWARAAAEIGQPRKVSALVDKAAAANPSDVELHLLAARIRLDLNQLQETDKRVRALYARHPEEPGVLLLSADLAHAIGQAGAEGHILDTLAARNPSFAPGRLARGRLYLQQGNWPGALAEAQAAAAAAPNKPEPHRLAAVARLLMGEAGAAVAEARAATELGSQDAVTQMVLAVAAQQHGDKDLSAEAIRNASRLWRGLRMR